MKDFTLKDFYKKVAYLENKATLSELLTFLGLRLSEESRKGYYEGIDVYEFIEGGSVAIGVYLDKSKAHFYEDLNIEDYESINSPWGELFSKNLNLVARLLDLLEERYSYLGSLSFEFYYYGNLVVFDIDFGPCGYGIRWLN
jgi:hypothetical protein